MSVGATVDELSGGIELWLESRTVILRSRWPSIVLYLKDSKEAPACTVVDEKIVFLQER